MTSLVPLITPTNLASERDKFFASNTYNPVFTYSWQDKPDETTFSSKTKQLLWEAIKLQDHNSITRLAGQFFEVEITESVLTLAQSSARTKGIISAGSSSEYATMLKDALDHFGLHDIQVIVTEEAGFNARPNHAKKTITISKHIHFDYFSMEGGVHHEMVHVLRYRNGIHNRVKRSQHYLPTEEGLASWCQDNANDDNGLAQHAIEYVASSVGLRGSLRDVYNCMRELGMSEDLSWKRSSRHKFGFVDTKMGGDILKPAMYFANEIKIGKLSTDEKLRLFVGKIALSELENYPDYTGIWQNQKLVEFFKL